LQSSEFGRDTELFGEVSLGAKAEFKVTLQSHTQQAPVHVSSQTSLLFSSAQAAQPTPALVSPCCSQQVRRR